MYWSDECSFEERTYLPLLLRKYAFFDIHATRIYQKTRRYVREKKRSVLSMSSFLTIRKCHDRSVLDNSKNIHTAYILFEIARILSIE